MDSTQNLAASLRLYEAICAALKDDRGIHIETAVTAAGYLAGYELLADSKINLSILTPGSAVFGVPGVDEAGPLVMTFIAKSCQSAGIKQSLNPDLSIPPSHAPLRSYLELMNMLLPPYRQLAAQTPSPPKLKWILPATAAVRFITAGQSVLPPAIGQALAINAVVVGAKTVPPAIAKHP